MQDVRQQQAVMGIESLVNDKMYMINSTGRKHFVASAFLIFCTRGYNLGCRDRQLSIPRISNFIFVAYGMISHRFIIGSYLSACGSDFAL